MKLVRQVREEGPVRVGLPLSSLRSRRRIGRVRLLVFQSEGVDESGGRSSVDSLRVLVEPDGKEGSVLTTFQGPELWKIG